MTASPRLHTDPAPPLLRATEVGELLSLSPKSVYALASEGRLPCVRLSRRCIRFEPAAVAQFIADARSQGAVA